MDGNHLNRPDFKVKGEGRWESSVSRGKTRAASSAACAPRYLLSLQRLVDGEVSVVVHAENDDFPGVVEPGSSRHVNPLVLGGYDGGDGVTWKRGGWVQGEHG